MKFFNFTLNTNIEFGDSEIVNIDDEFHDLVKNAFLLGDNFSTIAEVVASKIIESTDYKSHIIIDLPLWLVAHVEKVLAFKSSVLSVNYYDSGMIFKSITFEEFKKSGAMRSKLNEILHDTADIDILDQSSICNRDVYLDPLDLFKQVRHYNQALKSHNERFDNAEVNGDSLLLILEDESLAHVRNSLKKKLANAGLKNLLNSVE